MIPVGLVASSTIGRGYYGTLAMDGVSNLQVGATYEYACSLRFQAAYSGTVVGFSMYWIGLVDGEPEEGYSGGTGGTVRITVERDDGGVPDGSALTSFDVVAAESGLPYYEFDEPVPVTAGQVYHVAFRNVDPDPVTNFVSVNCARVDEVTDYQSRPGPPIAALFTYDGGEWEVAPLLTPVLDLTYGDGSHQGQGYMEVEPGSSISGDDMVRERFTVSAGSRIVTGVAVRIAKVSGSDSLLVRLEDNSGTLIDSVSISTSGVPVLPDPAGSAAGEWVSGSFSAPVLLTNGQTYRLRLSVAGTTDLWTRGIQQGSGYGFTAATYFADGVFEVSSDGGSTWAYVEPGLSSTGDLQFHFI